MCNKTTKLIGTVPNGVLSPTYKSILKEFVTYGDWKTGTKIRPSLPTISKSTGYSLRTIKRAKAIFLHLGILKKTAKHCMRSHKAEEMCLDFMVVDILSKVPVDKRGIKPKSSDMETLGSSDTEAPNNIIDIICINTVGEKDFVDNTKIDPLEAADDRPPIEGLISVVVFLTECKKTGMDVSGKIERYRGLVPEEYLQALAA